jgi:hypothetical protein
MPTIAVSKMPLSPIPISCDTYQDKGCKVIGIIINQAEEEKTEELRKTLTKIFPPRICPRSDSPQCQT